MCEDLYTYVWFYMHYVYVCIYVCIIDMCMYVYKFGVIVIKKVGLEPRKEDTFISLNSDQIHGRFCGKGCHRRSETKK